MEYRRLGRAGIKVSAVGLGTWLNFAGDQAALDAVVDAAIESGINFFDTANTDGRGEAELQLGRALRRHRREELVVATKVWGPMGDGVNERGLSRKHLRTQCEASLRRLGVEAIDLYQCQRYDFETTVEETLRTLDDLVRAGKIHYWGVSAWEESHVHNAFTLADTRGFEPPSSFQVRYSLLEREAEMSLLPTCRQRGLAPLAYAPLAQGVLTGKYLDGEPPADSRLADERRGANLRRRYGEAAGGECVAAVCEAAEQLGWQPAQVALAWVLRPEGATAAICGARTPAQVREDAAAAGLLLPEDIDLATIRR